MFSRKDIVIYPGFSGFLCLATVSIFFVLYEVNKILGLLYE